MQALTITDVNRQKQRIAIARALLKNPSILILDEATSALDGKSEIAVDSAVQRLMRQDTLTTITIAHKLGTIRRADRIIVLGPNGSVVEHGTYRELSKEGTEFTKLMNFQVMATKSEQSKKDRPEHEIAQEEEAKRVEREAKEEEKNTTSDQNPFI